MRLNTDRLIVRDFMNHDFPDYLAYIMDQELRRALGLNGVTDEVSARETFDWLIKNRTFLALEKKETGTVIGHICIHPPYAPPANDPVYRGKKGCSLFSQGKADYIDCEYTVGNAASKALQEKLGFVLWGKESFDAEEVVISVLEKEKATGTAGTVCVKTNNQLK